MRKETPKIESAQDWEKAINFIPKKEQIIIYDGVKESGKYIIPPRIKVGDGIHTVKELPFETSTNISYLEDQGMLVIN